jgi:hypothetical protein
MAEPATLAPLDPQDEATVTRGLLDTSVVVDHDVIDSRLLPDESAIAAVTLAELRLAKRREGSTTRMAGLCPPG